MQKNITIAIDAMGGDDSPNKIIQGIYLHSSKTKNIFYKIFGNKNLIEHEIKKVNLNKNSYEIVHTDEKIKDTDSALTGAKRGKNTSMWLSIESVKKKSLTL